MSHALFSYTEFIVAWILRKKKKLSHLGIIHSATITKFPCKPKIKQETKKIIGKKKISFSFLYLHKYILVQLAPKVNPSNDGNRLAYEMSSFQTNVHHPPFWYIVMYGSTIQPVVETLATQFKCGWLDTASSSIFTLFHVLIHHSDIKLFSVRKTLSYTT